MRRGALLAGLGLACSTLAEIEQSRECKVDDECLDQGGKSTGKICYLGSCVEDRLPPRAPLAVDIRSEPLGDPAFRVEVLGADLALDRNLTDRPYRYRISLANVDVEGEEGKVISGVRDRLKIAVTETRTKLQEGEDAATVPLAGSFTLSQSSRLGRSALSTPPIFYPPMNGGETEAVPQIELPWPRYDPVDDEADLPLVVELVPDADGEPPVMGNKRYGRGIVYRQIVRRNDGIAAQHNVSLSTVRECHRETTGSVRFPDGLPTPPPLLDGETPPKISVALRYEGKKAGGDKPQACDPTGAPAPPLCSVETLTQQPSPECQTATQCAPPSTCVEIEPGVRRCGCSNDDHCFPGDVCNLEQHLCALDLTDRPATKSFPVDPATPDFATWIYTYCDDDVTASREIALIVDVTPDIRLGLPTVQFRAALDYSLDIDGEPTPTTIAPLCLPTWQTVQPITLRQTQAPARVFKADTRAWVCCDTTCVDPAASGVPDAAVTCPLRGTLTATTTATTNIDDPDPMNPWKSCLAGGNYTGSVNLGDCAADEPECQVQLSAGPAGPGPQTYQLAIESPVGSIFQSATIGIDVATGTSALDLQLPYRVLLRGRVAVADCSVAPEGGTCTPEAEIVAERIIKDEPPGTLGPFFYTTSTLPGTLGEYVLPLDPGLYFLTALPKITIGTNQTAPSPIIILDLRPGSELVRSEGGVPVADGPDLLLAKSGVTYTIELDDFDLSTRAIPLDRTSWKGISFEFDTYDLNAPGVCDRTLACKIRRLRPGNSPVYLTQERLLNYVTRPATPDE